MNYLAHLYLSGDDEKIIVGNFVGDYIKGSNYKKFPPEIQKGIILHRQIDTFTDNHPKFLEAKQLLRNDFRLYSGIAVDLFYDYFLASSWNSFSEITLRQFSKNIHAILLSNFFYLPARVKGFLPFLIQNKRLESYASKAGIRQSLEIMSRYTSLPEKSREAITILKSNHSFFEENFTVFIKDIIEFVEDEFGIKIKKPG
jgi:acyl carrier protein phosphodiesterase